MEKVFDIQFEFDHQKLEQTIIEASLAGKGYCCFIDSNVVVEAKKQKNGELLNVLNKAIVNSCDGTYIAKLASLLYKKKYEAYNGPLFFKKFIYYPDTQCIIGNTKEVFDKIVNKAGKNTDAENLHFIDLPFVPIGQFNFEEIAHTINALKPRYIWVSLGAPKQEFFMNKLEPHLNQGVMLGVGAALNYFSGEINDIPKWAQNLSLIWFFRILTEPRKQIKRVFKIIKHYPRIYFEEKRKIRNISIVN